MAADAGPAHTARVTLQLDRGSETISGTFEDEHGFEHPFWGWLELSAALDERRGVDRVPGQSAKQAESDAI